MTAELNEHTKNVEQVTTRHTTVQTAMRKESVGLTAETAVK